MLSEFIDAHLLHLTVCHEVDTLTELRVNFVGSNQVVKHINYFFLRASSGIIEDNISACFGFNNIPCKN